MRQCAAIIAILAILACTVASSGSAQQSVAHQGGALGAEAPQTTAEAVRVTRAPIIDGSDSDDAWRSIEPVRGFRQFEPSENAPPTFETEFRVGYDDRRLYILIRAFDPHPDSIETLLSRRDVKTNSDQITVIIDGFLDKRNAIELIVNPAGVKRDAALYNDVTEDFSWDGVWDVGVRVDDAGWVAEFSVPFSQLRFRASDVNAFGFGVRRDVARLNQRDAWPEYRKTTRTLVSQLGTIQSIRGVPGARRVELLPYAVSKSVPNLSAPGLGNRTELTGGLDAKAGIGSSLTVDATVNPDFGQVEADPAILNLTAFETRFDERRPFFQEGIGLFRCLTICGGPFYTRRIGRTPQLRSNQSDPAFTTILGAAKLTGRLNGGYTLAILDAVTREERGVSGSVIEPQSNYFVMRAARASRDGARQVGLLVTDVRRELDATTAPKLRRSGTSALLQASTRFARNQYEVMAFQSHAWVTGTEQAIALTQRGSVHYFQRPDNDEHYDSTRTALAGGAIGGSFGKIGGSVKFETFLRHSAPQQEMNDLGLVPGVDDASIRQTLSYQQRAPNRWFRSSFSQLSAESHWTVGGLPFSRSATLHASASLANSWAGAITWSATDFGGVNCVSCARGGPSLRQSPNLSARFDVLGDPRMRIIPTGMVTFSRGDEGQSWGRVGQLGVNIRVASRFSASLTGSYAKAVNDQQWVTNFGYFLSDTTHYTFAHLDQETLSITTRVNWTATPALSFQLYGQPFVSAGSFTRWRELDAPRAAEYDDRFRSYGGGANPNGFNVKQFNSNAVIRWEYRPASVLFLVWQQGRDQTALNQGTFDASRDLGDLFGATPRNTLLVKLSYWFNP
ncbi:MAG: DUF5916 domain-containing protein [Gemmatimonadetes bacterium]|nr:DUF5916 domain-containing protein [Gemmatimonadota bacterium]